MTLYNFGPASPASLSGLVEGADGYIYGTNKFGGVNGYGTIFRITPEGSLTTLHTFDMNDGFGPNGLVQATNGDFYGATEEGGMQSNACSALPSGCGTVFRITASGRLTKLHAFQGPDGSAPENKLIQAIDGNLYGTTNWGGLNGVGTIFKITPEGALTTLHNFYGDFSVLSPSPLLQGTDGKLYGTTLYGGSDGSDRR